MGKVPTLSAAIIQSISIVFTSNVSYGDVWHTAVLPNNEKETNRDQTADECSIASPGFEMYAGARSPNGTLSS